MAPGGGDAGGGTDSRREFRAETETVRGASAADAGGSRFRWAGARAARLCARLGAGGAGASAVRASAASPVGLARDLPDRRRAGAARSVVYETNRALGGVAPHRGRRAAARVPRTFPRGIPRDARRSARALARRLMDTHDPGRTRSH